MVGIGKKVVELVIFVVDYLTCPSPYIIQFCFPLLFFLSSSFLPSFSSRYVHLPFLATLRSIKIAIFGNFLKQNVAKNGKNVTQVPI